MNNDKKQKTIKSRQDIQKNKILEVLEKMPILEVACKTSGVSRPTLYRWLKEDDQFKKALDGAMRTGEDFVNDLGESKLITLIQNNNFQAIQLWLRKHNVKYSDKIEIHGQIENTIKRELSDEDKLLIAKAIRSGLPAKEAPKDEPAKN